MKKVPAPVILEVQEVEHDLEIRSERPVIPKWGNGIMEVGETKEDVWEHIPTDLEEK